MLQELDEYKDKMLANVSHELKTPLNAINYMVSKVNSKLDLLIKELVDSRQNKKVKKMRNRLEIVNVNT